VENESNVLPVRGRNAIEILVNDHQVIKGLLQELTGASAKKQRKDVLERLKGALTIHNATEENIVYPAINRVARKRAEAEHLYHETAEADILVFELDTLLKVGEDSKFVAKAKKFHSAVLQHIENEETSAFPHLQEKADQNQSKMLTDSVRAFRNSVHFNEPA
jgi:hemerythrin superfamily protein